MSKLNLIISILPMVLAGTMNMAFVKSPVFDALKTPIDGGRLWWDNRPLFGPNKTWKGAWGMILFSAVFMMVFHLSFGHSLRNWTVYTHSDANRFVRPLLEGALMGLAYIVAELPNSFIKRRLEIAAGKNASGLKGLVFTVVDQADSVIGCTLVLLFITDIQPSDTSALILLGTGLHLLTNAALFLVGLKQQAR